jgi:hypothetical protein
MNAAYRHLESKTRIAELTLGQWAGIVLGVLVAVAFAVVLKLDFRSFERCERHADAVGGGRCERSGRLSGRG